jgi:hypothetical protein
MCIIASHLFVRFRLIKPIGTIEEHVQKLTEGEYSYQPAVYTDKVANFSLFSKELTHLGRELDNATNFVINLQKGNTEVAFKDLKGDLKEKPLAQALAALQQQIGQLTATEQQRSWSADGYTQFVDLIRSYNDKHEELYDAATGFICKYTGASYGLLYTLSEDKQELIVNGCYAHERSQLLHKRFHITEGLPGQAFQDRHILYINQIPTSAMAINSGLGQALPGALLLVPLQINNQTVGVLELGTIGSFQDFQKELISRMSEALAAAIAGVMANIQNTKLLEETQKQTKAMRAQEDVMRKNLQKMQAMREDLERKVSEMEQLKHEENERMEGLRKNQQKMLGKILEKHQKQLAEKDAEIAELKLKLSSATSQDTPH